MEEEKLHIPENCPPLEYIIEGFTGFDIVGIASVGAVALIIAIVNGVSGGNMIKSVFTFLGIVGITILLFRRDRYTENFFDKVNIQIKYVRSVKEYLYEYVNIYEDMYKKMQEAEGKKTNEKNN